MKISKLCLFLVLILAAFLRLYKLDSYPALNADEASIGYDAYSLLETGKDQHGNPWPIHFQSFNDYKPGLIVYLIIPVVKLMGLSVLSVRLLPAIVSILSILLTYLLVGELIKQKLINIPGRNLTYLPLFCAFVLAVNPWHIHFSRGAWEAGVSLFFTMLGILLFMKARDNFRYLTLSFISFSVAIYTYHAARIVIPVLIFALTIQFKKLIQKNKRMFILSILSFMVLLFPVLFDLTFGNALKRAGGVGLTADPGVVLRSQEQQWEHFLQGYGGKYLPRIMHNKYINYTLMFAKNVSEHFNGNFLFIDGDGIQRNKVPEMGQFYLFEIITIALGVFYFIRRKYNINLFLFIWILASSVPAALTFQSPHALRSLNMVIPISIISGLGLFFVFTRSKKGGNLLSNLICVIFALLVLWNISYYFHQYYLHMAKTLPYSSQYGLPELVDYLDNIPDDKLVVISDRYDQPYVLFLFYLKYPPGKFQDNHILTNPDKFGFSTVREFDRYKFITLEWESDKKAYPGAVIAGADGEVPDAENVIKEIYGTNNYKYFQVVAN